MITVTKSFGDVDENSSYLLGWIASMGVICTTTWQIYFETGENFKHFQKMKNMIDSSISISLNEDNVISFSITSKNVVEDVSNILQIDDGNGIRLPKFEDCYKWSFLRGYFDGSGSISSIEEEGSCPECRINSTSRLLLKDIQEFTKIPCSINDEYIRMFINLYDINCIDFLHHLYDKSLVKLQEKYSQYVDWYTWNPIIRGTSGVGRSIRLPECFVYKTDEDAVLPSKEKGSDVGYDITVIRKVKDFSDSVSLYDTGIKICLQDGLYGQVVPRSSLSKSGYFLANSIGIIDRAYRGNLYVALAKLDKNMPDVKLPFRCCQLIFQYHHPVNLLQVSTDFSDTERGIGGFGSTGV